MSQRIVRTRSIPNVDDDRLRDDALRLCAMLHGVAAMQAFDGPRRELLDNGRKLVAIKVELTRRGQPFGCCDRFGPR